MNSQQNRVPKSYQFLMDELRKEQNRAKAEESIGKAVLISVGMLLGSVALVTAAFWMIGL